MINKLFEPVFIFFSKIYIFFYKDRGDNWFIYPAIILATILTINLETVSFFLIDVNKYFYVGVAIFFIIFFNLLFKNISYEYVKNYKMSNKTKVIITIIIFIDLVINFVFLNISRNGEFMF
jgi:hypothetical protein